MTVSYLPEEEQDGWETAEWVQKAGRKAVAYPGDLREERFCEELVSKAVSEFGTIDLLANIAAFQNTHEELEEFTTEEFDRAFKTNVYALFWLCRAALPKMNEGSAIINTASIQAYDPSLNLLPYAATKSAIVSCTKSLSQLAMKRGVRVNAVAPGPVWTPLIPSTMPEKKVKDFGKNTLFERPAQPVEISPVYVFLASNEARFVTGEVYGITGGKLPFNPLPETSNLAGDVPFWSDAELLMRRWPRGKNHRIVAVYRDFSLLHRNVTLHLLQAIKQLRPPHHCFVLTLTETNCTGTCTATCGVVLFPISSEFSSLLVNWPELERRAPNKTPSRSRPVSCFAHRPVRVQGV